MTTATVRAAGDLSMSWFYALCGFLRNGFGSFHLLNSSIEFGWRVRPSYSIGSQANRYWASQGQICPRRPSFVPPIGSGFGILICTATWDIKTENLTEMW